MPINHNDARATFQCWCQVFALIIIHYITKIQSFSTSLCIELWYSIHLNDMAFYVQFIFGTKILCFSITFCKYFADLMWIKLLNISLFSFNRATFVRAFSEFYVPVYSEVLKYTGDNNLPNGTFPTPHECRVCSVI